eukprot:5465799-Ditylum_brightwellii.AAC.1
MEKNEDATLKVTIDEECNTNAHGEEQTIDREEDAYHNEDALEDKDAWQPIKMLTWLQKANEGELKERTTQKMQTTRCVNE